MRMGHFFPPRLGIRSIFPNKYMIFFIFFFLLKAIFPQENDEGSVGLEEKNPQVCNCQNSAFIIF